MVDLLFKKIAMARIVTKKKKTSAILKHYVCTGLYLACTCTCTEVLFKVLVLYLSTFQSTWPHAWSYYLHDLVIPKNPGGLLILGQ